MDKFFFRCELDIPHFCQIFFLFLRTLSLYLLLSPPVVSLSLPLSLLPLSLALPLLLSLYLPFFSQSPRLLLLCPPAFRYIFLAYVSLILPRLHLWAIPNWVYSSQTCMKWRKTNTGTQGDTRDTRISVGFVCLYSPIPGRFKKRQSTQASPFIKVRDVNLYRLQSTVFIRWIYM